MHNFNVPSVDIVEFFGLEVGESIKTDWRTVLSAIPNSVNRCTFNWKCNQYGARYRTYIRTGESWNEETLIRDIHPEVAHRLALWRLDNFTLERLDSYDRVYAFKGVAKTNAKDRRIFVFAEVYGDNEDQGAPLWEFEKHFLEAAHMLRGIQSKENHRTRFRWCPVSV